MRALPRILAALLLALAPSGVFAAGTPIQTSIGYCQLSVTTAVLLSTCTGGIPQGTTAAKISNEGAAYRWRDDGGAPTTSLGMPVATGTATAPITFDFYGSFAAMQIIAQTGTTVLDITFYR